MVHPILEAFGVEKLIREAVCLIEDLLSSRFVRLLIVGMVVLYAMLLVLSAFQQLVSRIQPACLISPLWRFAALAFLTANLHLRMTMAV